MAEKIMTQTSTKRAISTTSCLCSRTAAGTSMPSATCATTAKSGYADNTTRRPPARALRRQMRKQKIATVVQIASMPVALTKRLRPKSRALMCIAMATRK
jgi:hypothetical protein